MAEHEVRKHTVRAVKLFRDKEKKGWEKVKEILLEVGIIVFAITLSLWMHNRSEESHNRENVKQFLLGVKEDLKNDLAEMAEDSAAIYERTKSIGHLLDIAKGNILFNPDSANYYFSTLAYSTTLLIPNNGRYEGFKSSGQIGYIDNKELANLIVDHYQEKITGLLWVSQTQNDFHKNQFTPFVNTNFISNHERGFSNLASQVRDNKFTNLLINYRINARAMMDRYRTLIKSSQDIIAAIDKEDL